MKIQSWLVLIMLVLLMACDRQPQSSVRGEGGEESLRLAKESTLQQKERYAEAIEKKLQDLAVKITELKTKAVAMNGETKTDLDEGVNSLATKAQDLRKRLADLKITSAKQWETMREDIEERLKNLEKTFARVSSKFSA